MIEKVLLNACNGLSDSGDESSNWAQLLPPVLVRLSPAPCPVEGGKMGVGEVVNSTPQLL